MQWHSKNQYTLCAQPLKTSFHACPRIKSIYQFYQRVYYMMARFLFGYFFREMVHVVPKRERLNSAWMHHIQQVWVCKNLKNRIHTGGHLGSLQRNLWRKVKLILMRKKDCIDNVRKRSKLLTTNFRDHQGWFKLCGVKILKTSKTISLSLSLSFSCACIILNYHVHGHKILV